MRRTALTRSSFDHRASSPLSAPAAVRSTPRLDAVQPHKGGTTSPPAASAGTSGTSTGAGGSGVAANCVAEMGATGLCKRCYDASGVLVHEDCPPPPTGNDPACVEITEGGPGTCTDYATYKIRSSDVCAQKNLFISNLEARPDVRQRRCRVDDLRLLSAARAVARHVQPGHGHERTGLQDLRGRERQRSSAPTATPTSPA